MSRHILRPKTDVCHLCDFITARNFARFQSRSPRKPLQPRALSTTVRRGYAQESPPAVSRSPIVASSRPIVRSSNPPKSRFLPEHASLEELQKKLQEIELLCKRLLVHDKVTAEGDTQFVLLRCNTLAQWLVQDSPSPPINRKDGAASALLSLDEASKAKKIPFHQLPPNIQRIADQLSKITYSIVEYPNVFITPKVLEIYTAIQSSLGKAETFPEVFNLYANKPLPEEDSSPVKFAEQNPNKIANAIPIPIANQALQTAIDTKQLGVAMDIINATYTKTAFLRAKAVRHGLIPVAALAVTPVAAYVLASKFAMAQTSMDPDMATNMAFTGIIAYIGLTATVGVVAVSTANDQMERVTWAPGMPLKERWIREDERAAIDKIACSWGFKEVWRRGEEEGEDWDNLREWTGQRGMILDRVELMEGME